MPSEINESESLARKNTKLQINKVVKTVGEQSNSAVFISTKLSVLLDSVTN